MKKTIVVCGDSFNYGTGCTNLYTKPYGPLVAQHFGWDCVRLARGSSSNFVTHLQGSYAAREMHPKPHLVVLGITSYDRIEWVAEGDSLQGGDAKLTDVNYHQYPPHLFPEPHHDEPMPFFLDGHDEYKPKILSEQVVAFDEYIRLYKKAVSTKNPEANVDGIPVNLKWYKRLHTEPIEKIELIYNYYMQVMSSEIKRSYDMGVILKTYIEIKKQGIKCIILSPDTGYKDFVQHESDFFHQPWGEMSKKWPTNCFHTGDGGHEDTSLRLIDHIIKYNLN
jgi:hypothetical protein